MATEARLNLVITAQDQAKTVIEGFVNSIKTAFDGLSNLTVGANFATAFEEQFREMVSATEQSTTEMRNIFDLLDTGLDGIATNTDRMVQEVISGFDNMSTDIRNASEEIVLALDQTGQASQHLNDALDFQNLQMAGEMIQQVGEQITGFFEHAVTSAADFDQNIVNTTASLDANMGAVKLNTVQIKAMQDAAIQMGQSGFFSANQVAEAMNTMAKQGLTYQQIMSGGIDVVYKVAAANQSDLESTANVVADIYNEMGDIFKKSGMSAQQASQLIGNSMTVALHHARISMEDFMNTMKYVGPQASAMGIGIKDVSAAIALLGQHGIRGTQAGTTLRTMLTNLTPASKAAAAEMKSLGMITANGSNIFFDASGHMKSMAEVQQILHDKIGALNPQMQEMAIKTIFGRYALSGMTAIVDTAPGKFQGLTSAMNNNNVMTDIMKEKSQGLGMQIQQLNAHWQTVQKTIGEALKPVVEWLIGGLNKLMGAWEGLSPGVKQAIIVIGAVTGVVLLVGGALLAIVGTIGMFAMAWGAALPVLGAIAGPAAIVIGVLAAIGVAAFLLVTHWKQVTSALGSAWNWIKNTAVSIWNGLINFFKQWGTTLLAVFVPVIGIPVLIKQHWQQITSIANQIFTSCMNAIKSIWNAAVSWIKGIAQDFVNIIVDAFKWMYDHNYYFQDLVNFIKNAWNTIQKDAESIWNTIKNFLNTLWNSVKSAATSTWNAIKSSLSSIWTAIVSAAKSTWNGLTTFLSGLWTTISSAVSTAWNGIKSTMSNLASQAISAVKGPFNSLGSFFSGLASQAYQWGSNLVGMVANGITSAIGSVTSAVSSVASGIKSLLGFHSPTETGPASDSDQWMPNMMKMFVGGIKQHAPELQMAIGNVALGLKTGTTNMGNTIHQNHIAIPSNGTNAAHRGGTNIYINIDGRSAKTDNELANVIAEKLYRQMPVVS